MSAATQFRHRRSSALIPKYAIELAARVRELRVRDTGICAAGLMLGGFLLSGCSSASLLGAQDASGTSPTFSSRISSFFASATPGTSQPHSPTPSAPEIECPGVDIRNGASTLNIAAKGDQATAGDLRYQLSFGQTARECTVQGETLNIKVGVQGRLILGPMGAPGSVDVPLRYAVVREGPEPRTIVTKFKRSTATIAPGQTHVQFVDIEENLNFPLPAPTELDAYVVYVGFDEIGDPSEKKPVRAAKKPAKRQQ
jgi:hypothetical protein